MKPELFMLLVNALSDYDTAQAELKREWANPEHWTWENKEGVDPNVHLKRRNAANDALIEAARTFVREYGYEPLLPNELSPASVIPVSADGEYSQPEAAGVYTLVAADTGFVLGTLEALALADGKLVYSLWSNPNVGDGE